MIKRNTLPTQQRLKELYDYNELTGVLTNKKTGNVLGSKAINPRDYIYVMVDSIGYLAQRIIWKWMTGCEPDEVVDHINRDKRDNRWCNLRDVSWSENVNNNGKPTKPKKDSEPRKPAKGYSYYKRTGMWCAQMRLNGALHWLGTFATEADAQAAVTAWKLSYSQPLVSMET